MSWLPRARSGTWATRTSSAGGLRMYRSLATIDVHTTFIVPLQIVVAGPACGRGRGRARGPAPRRGRAALLPAGQRAADRQGPARPTGSGRKQAGRPGAGYAGKYRRLPDAQTHPHRVWKTPVLCRQGFSTPGSRKPDSHGGRPACLPGRTRRFAPTTPGLLRANNSFRRARGSVSVRMNSPLAYGQILTLRLTETVSV